jgi:hypothetical protein
MRACAFQVVVKRNPREFTAYPPTWKDWSKNRDNFFPWLSQARRQDKKSQSKDASVLQLPPCLFKSSLINID